VSRTLPHLKRKTGLDSLGHRSPGKGVSTPPWRRLRPLRRLRTLGGADRDHRRPPPPARPATASTASGLTIHPFTVKLKAVKVLRLDGADRVAQAHMQGDPGQLDPRSRGLQQGIAEMEARPVGAATAPGLPGRKRVSIALVVRLGHRVRGYTRRQRIRRSACNRPFLSPPRVALRSAKRINPRRRLAPSTADDLHGPNGGFDSRLRVAGSRLLERLAVLAKATPAAILRGIEQKKLHSSRHCPAGLSSGLENAGALTNQADRRVPAPPADPRPA